MIYMYYGCSQPRELWFHDFNLFRACTGIYFQNVVFKMTYMYIPVPCICIFGVLYEQGYICHPENHRVFEGTRVLLH